MPFPNLPNDLTATVIRPIRIAFERAKRRSNALDVRMQRVRKLMHVDLRIGRAEESRKRRLDGVFEACNRGEFSPVRPASLFERDGEGNRSPQAATQRLTQRKFR